MTVPDAPALLHLLRTQAPASPRLTWYGPDGDRVDLSGKVFAQWVTKTANLLAGELDVAPGEEVGLALGAHWRTLVWALATWTVGASVRLDEPGAAPVLVCDAAACEPSGATTVAVPLPALAMRVTDLPAGALDGAAEVMNQPDALVLPGAGTGADPAFAEGGPSLTELLAGGAGGRVLLVADGARRLLGSAPAVWAAGGSVVLVGEPGADAARLEHLAATEHAGRA